MQDGVDCRIQTLQRTWCHVWPGNIAYCQKCQQSTATQASPPTEAVCSRSGESPRAGPDLPLPSSTFELPILRASTPGRAGRKLAATAGPLLSSKCARGLSHAMHLQPPKLLLPHIPSSNFACFTKLYNVWSHDFSNSCMSVRSHVTRRHHNTRRW